jgi:hypothetical protein
MGRKNKEKLEELEGAVVEAPRADPGPLAPWRLSIAVAVSAAFTGLDLYDAAMTGVGVDMTLIRSFGVAFVVWIAVGFVNRVLRDAQAAVEADKPKPVQASPRPWVDERSDDVESSTA